MDLGNLTLETLQPLERLSWLSVVAQQFQVVQLILVKIETSGPTV